MSTTDTINSLIAASASKRQRAVADYRAAIRSLAAGDSVAPNKVEQAIEAAGQTLEQARADVDRLKARAEARAGVARGIAADEVLSEVRAQIETLRTQLERDIAAATAKLTAKFEAAVAPLTAKAEKNKPDSDQLTLHRQRLHDSADPAALAALDDARTRRARAQEKLREAVTAEKETREKAERGHIMEWQRDGALRRAAAAAAEAQAELSTAEADVIAATAAVEDENW